MKHWKPSHRSPQIARRYDFDSWGAEIHEQACDCPYCVDAVSISPARLTAADLGRLSLLGALVGNAIAFAIDPHGAAAALRSAVGL